MVSGVSVQVSGKVDIIAAAGLKSGQLNQQETVP
jgi:hypothetical protein